MLVLAIISLSLTLSPKPAALVSAEKSCQDLKIVACLKELDTVLATESLDLDAHLSSLRLKGIVAAQANKPAKAQEALRKLFVLSPDHAVPTSYAPRVNTQILEARAWAKEQGALTVEAISQVTPSKALRVGLRVTADVFAYARSVRLHVASSKGEWTRKEVVFNAAEASVDVDARSVEWWAQLLGENDSVLREFGSALKPLTHGLPAVVEAKPSLVVSPEVQAKVSEAPAAVLVPAPAPARFRPAALAVAGVGVGLLVAGLYFASSASALRRDLQQPQLNDMGVSLRTQVEANQLNSQMQTQSWVANGLFIGSGLALLSSGILLIAGWPRAEP